MVNRSVPFFFISTISPLREGNKIKNAIKLHIEALVCNLVTWWQKKPFRSMLKCEFKKTIVFLNLVHLFTFFCHPVIVKRVE